MSARRHMRVWTSAWETPKLDAFIRFGGLAVKPGFVCMEIGDGNPDLFSSDGEVALDAKGLRRLAAMAIREAETLERKAGVR